MYGPIIRCRFFFFCLRESHGAVCLVVVRINQVVTFLVINQVW